MNMIKPDMKSLVWFAAGAFLLPKLMKRF